MNDTWLIGDAFLKTVFPVLQSMKTSAQISKNNIPYLYKYFNVHAFFKLSNGSAEGSLYHIFNALVEGMNKFARFPRFIIFIPDCDIIVHTNFFGYGVKEI